MLKYQAPLNRFVAVDNDTVDEIDDMVVKGLLITLIRQKPGEDMTIESLSKTHKQGRKTLEAAMRDLVERGLVVKLKIQSIHGNRWRTQFTVADREIPREHIQEWIDSVEDARAIRVEPARLDPRGAEEITAPVSPTAANGPVGENEEKSQVSEGEGNDSPTGPFPTVGGATVAEAAAKEETVFTQYGAAGGGKTEHSLRASRSEAALPGGESESRPGGDPVFEELLRQFGGGKTQQQGQEPAIALPGGTALVAGEVVGAPTAWQEGIDGEEE